MTDKSPEGTASLDKALDVLDAVGSTPAGLSQAELQQRLGLPRTTLYRLLGTLVARRLLRRDPMRRVYGLGLRCFEYARAAYAMPELVAAAAAELRALRDMSGETTYLAALDGLEVVALERCDSAHPERSQTEIGARKPLHCTSQGKAILAALPAEEREALVRQLPMQPLTPRSITDRRKLLAELRATATRGFSIDDEEIVPGVRCAGAAIVDGDGQVRGSISMAGPAFRLTMERVEALGPELADSARRIGRQLSARPDAAAGEAGNVAAVPGDWAFDGALPFWHGGAEALFWADLLGPAVHCAQADGDRVLWHTEAPIRQLLPHRDGLLLQTAAGAGWLLAPLDGSPPQPLTQAPPPTLFSSACAAPDGGLWACVPESDIDGITWWVREPASAAPGWKLPEPATAMAWDGAGRTLYVVTAGNGCIWAAVPGQPVLRRLTTVPRGSGQLGGLAVDAQGGLWSALRGGWGVVRFVADGFIDRVVALPVPAPTGVAFGAGACAETLFVTTAREAVGREALDAAPLSGRLLRLRAGVAGLSVPLLY